jgi:cytochrome c oxidase subunit 2
MILATAEQFALTPAGPQAEQIRWLWWIFFGVTAAIYVLVMGALLLAMKKRSSASDPSPVVRAPTQERSVILTISTAVGLTIPILFGLMIMDFIVGRRLHALAASPGSLEIKITGHQWWWEVQYVDSTPSNIVTTANEIHLPVGVPIQLKLDSADVIHSFWAPNLHGKKDLIPGHPTTHWLQADRTGEFIGQCAEFCGHQHAHMRMTVIVQERSAFDQWLKNQRQPAVSPQSLVQARGQEIFLRSTCITCHTITGTPAGGQVGPSLTHLASRQSIAARTLPNQPASLARWIRNPQAIKPGVIMPQHALDADDLESLVAYLESLQ